MDPNKDQYPRISEAPRMVTTRQLLSVALAVFVSVPVLAQDCVSATGPVTEFGCTSNAPATEYDGSWLTGGGDACGESGGLLGGGAGLFGDAASQDDSPFFFRFGVGRILFDESARISLGGAVVPGASYTVENNTTFLFDIGYELSPNWAVVFGGGYPPKTSLRGTGPFAGLKYGQTKYAPAKLLLERRFQLSDATTIFVGGGVAYAIFYESLDDAVADFDLDNSFGWVARVGIEQRLTDRWSAFAQAEYVDLSADATGFALGAPVDADLTIDPTVLFFGLRYDL